MDRFLKVGTFALLLAVVGQLGYDRYTLPPGRPAPNKERISTAPKDLLIDVSNHPTQGSGQLALLEFSDFECPFCKQFALETSPKLDEEFAGRLRRIFFNNPLPALHKGAVPFAEWASCQADFWKAYRTIFNLGRPDRPLSDIQRDLLPGCLARIDSDASLARKLGLVGTPSFALGTVEGDKVRAQKILLGALPFEEFSSTINQLLKEKL